MSEETAERAENGQAGTLPRCTATCVDGARCKAQARPGQATCLFHSPEAEALLKESRRKGGLSRQAMLLPVDLGIGELRWETVDGLLAIIGAAAEKMLAGQLDPSRARALSDMATKVLAGLRDQVMESRLAAVEAMLRKLEAHGVVGD